MQIKGDDDTEYENWRIKQGEEQGISYEKKEKKKE